MVEMQMSQLAPPIQYPEFSPEDSQHLVLENASWDLYEQLLKAVGNRPIRLTYDTGRLEIMSPLPEHEQPKTIIGRFIEMLALERSMDMASYGSTTFRSKQKSKGLEPDECYYFRAEAQMRGRKRINLRKDPPPELVVEIDISSRSVPREPIYAAMGVPELWRFGGGVLQCLHLVNGHYRNRKFSLVFPFLEPAQLTRFIQMAVQDGENFAVKSFMKWVRENGWSE
jgi:Uma2 family endonuclease